MTDAFQSLVDDLAAEHEALAGVLASVPFERWEHQTHAPGWAIRDQVAHLAQFDDVARLAIEEVERFTAMGRSGANYLEEARTRPVAEIAAWWREASEKLISAARTLDASRRMPWFGPPMAATSFITARLMECWSHGLDVVDVAGVEREPSDRLRHIAHLGVRTRGFSYVTRGLEPNQTPVKVELVLPSGEPLVFGDTLATQSIRGRAIDFCQVVTQRRHYADTRLEIDGPDAEEWMRFAQAFAGPPGEGRKPGQFTQAHP
ncbi:MAG: TIGR03084 family metal-binding protein [Dehalococcoidia bacterium]